MVRHGTSHSQLLGVKFPGSAGRSNRSDRYITVSSSMLGIVKISNQWSALQLLRRYVILRGKEKQHISLFYKYTLEFSHKFKRLYSIVQIAIV